MPGCCNLGFYLICMRGPSPQIRLNSPEENTQFTICQFVINKIKINPTCTAKI